MSDFLWASRLLTRLDRVNSNRTFGETWELRPLINIPIIHLTHTMERGYLLHPVRVLRAELWRHLMVLQNEGRLPRIKHLFLLPLGFQFIFRAFQNFAVPTAMGSFYQSSKGSMRPLTITRALARER